MSNIQEITIKIDKNKYAEEYLEFINELFDALAEVKRVIDSKEGLNLDTSETDNMLWQLELLGLKWG